ncbi:porin [Reichenbachiella sp.]|uniref:porin n=1 Tax=Reichenbachiella sp. TaxID=2184521 RepID=UPI003297ECD2
MKNLMILLAAVLIGTLPRHTHAQGCAEPSADEGVRVFGYLQPQFDYNFSEDEMGTFKFNRMRIGVMGTIPYDFSYYALLETSSFATGDVFLIDAFVSYTRFENFKISMGSFKKPFGLELSTPCSGLNTIRRTKVVNELTAPNRDLGLMILGGNDQSLFTYRVAIMNGNGVGELDDNNFKDLYGRVTIKPTPFMRIGSSGQYGKQTSSVADAPEDERWRLGADVDLKMGHFWIQSEYVYGKDVGSYTTGGGCDGDIQLQQGSVTRDGFYVTGMYNVTDKIQPVIKYEQYDNNRDESNNLRQVTTLGVNYFANDWTRLQLNYLYATEDPEEIKNDMLMFQVQVKF